MRKTAAALTVVLVFVTASFPFATNSASGAAAAENSWATKAPMQVARSYVGVGVVNGKIYAIGGSTQHGSAPDNLTGGFVGTNEEYDPATDTWTYKTAMPTPRHYFATAVYQGRIYCIGGYLNNGTVSGINEVYDPATDSWETKAPMKTIRIGLVANVADGRIYLIGGYIPGYYTTQNFTGTPVNEAYDPAADSWASKAPIPIAVVGYASAVVDNKIYVFGGVSYPEYNFNQIYDPKTDTWTRGTASPKNTAYGAAGATTGVNALKRIYVLSQDYNFDNPPYVNSVYDPANDIWTAGAPMPTERNGFGVAVVNDMLYVIGGSTETFDFFWNSHITLFATNEQYTPIGYGISDPTYDGKPPEITLMSPENTTYYETGIPLNFSINEPVSQMLYKLDNETAVPVCGNTTLIELSLGSHNLQVYATDIAGNNAVSETIHFTIAERTETEPIPTTLMAVASATTFVVTVAGLLIYHRRKQTRESL